MAGFMLKYYIFNEHIIIRISNSMLQKYIVNELEIRLRKDHMHNFQMFLYNAVLESTNLDVLYYFVFAELSLVSKYNQGHQVLLHYSFHLCQNQAGIKIYSTSGIRFI